MIRGIHHVAVSTGNLERLLDFYCRVLGFELVQQDAWSGNRDADEVIGIANSAARKVMLRAGSIYLEVFEFSRPQARNREPLRACDRGYTHLALQVEDIDAEYRRLGEQGVVFNCEVKQFGDVRSVYGLDPDGNIFEMIEVLERAHPCNAQAGR